MRICRLPALCQGITLSLLAGLTQAADLEIHGSNTIGAQLAPKLAQRFIESMNPERPPVLRRGQQPNEQYVVSAKPPFSIHIAAHGSSTGFAALKGHQAHIWASSRPAKDKEVAALADRGNLQSPDNEHVIAIDGLAIIVHPGNPLAKLSINTLRSIFSGRIKSWKELGGSDRPIHIHARDANSGTWDTFSSLVLKDATLVGAAQRHESNHDLAKAVQQDPDAIGFTSLHSIGQTKTLAIAEGLAPARQPSLLTVAAEDYPLTRRLFFYTLAQQTPDQGQALVAYALSKAGQQAVEETGFISLTPKALPAEYDDQAPESFRQLTRGYDRLSVNFRFSGEDWTTLDNKAHQDLSRLRDYMHEHGSKPRELMLIGFADAADNGNPMRAQLVSELRVKAVSRALKQQGIKGIPTIGYGHYMPVGAQGSQRNDRVEVWIRSRSE